MIGLAKQVASGQIEDPFKAFKPKPAQEIVELKTTGRPDSKEKKRKNILSSVVKKLSNGNTTDNYLSNHSIGGIP